MDAAVLFRRLADVIEKRRQHSPSEHSLVPDATAGDKPRWAITSIWNQLKARARRPSGQDDALAPPAQQPTLTVKVVFMGDLPSIIGQRGIAVTLPQEATVAELFESLSGTYGELFTSRVFRGPGKLHPTMLVLVDGENITALGGLGAKLGNSEVEVFMLPIIEGG